MKKEFEFSHHHEPSVRELLGLDEDGSSSCQVCAFPLAKQLGRIRTLTRRLKRDEHKPSRQAHSRAMAERSVDHWIDQARLSPEEAAIERAEFQRQVDRALAALNGQTAKVKP